MIQKARRLRIRYLACALVALVMIIYGAVHSALGTRASIAEFGMVRHTRDVLDALRAALSAMQDLELGQRGYIIVGREEYLEPYSRSIGIVDKQLGKVDELTKSNTKQQERLGRLMEAARLKKGYLARTIEARRTMGEEEAKRMTATGEGKLLMDNFRGMIMEMSEAEEQLLFERRETLISNLRRTNMIVGLTGGIAILAGAIGIVVLMLYLRSQERMEKLRSEKEKAVQSDQAKSEFLAMMSHEIRTPMNAILGFGELLEDSVQESQQKHYAKAILSSGNSLLLLINDILDLSKIEASKLELHPDLVDMRAFAASLETLFSYRAQEKGLAYSVDLDPAMPGILTFDALRLRQIMVNLIGNALKFTGQGEVRVKIRPEERAGDERVWLNIEVSDTGIGIAKEQLEQIFRPFYQVDSRSSRNYQGTGLGLNISERLAEAMEGEISVESEPGKGSTFRLSVPTRRSTKQESVIEDPKTAVDFNMLAPAKVLVADDVALNRELIRGYLESSHHQIYEAENGEQALAICEQYDPDIVLMDIRMPVMDGKETRFRLKENEKTKRIPLIAISASSLLNSQKELKLLFDGYADKPLSRGRLFVEMSRFLPAAPNAGKDGETPTEDVSGDAVCEGVKDVGLLVRSLRDLEKSPWPELVKLMPVQATIAFSDKLVSLAERHQAANLASYADRLRKSAKMLDLQELSKLLKSFPKTINSFPEPDA